MKNFVGKWKQVEGEPENIREFMKAAGVPDDVAEKNLNPRYDAEIKADGNKWTMLVSTTEEPIHTFTLEFTLGEPYDALDIFGRRNKMVTVVDSDTTARETWICSDESVIEIFREIKGDKMFNTYTCNGVSMKTIYTRD